MRTSLYKKAMALTLASVMTIGATGIVSARVADGTNVVSGEWKSFSVCTEDDKDELHAVGKKTWRESMEEIVKKDDAGNEMKDANGNPIYFTYGTDFATEGWITAGKTSSDFDFYVKNTGWDGEYNTVTGDLAGDNPWGLTATMENIPVEAGRNYTISFRVNSTLRAAKKDEKGNITGYLTQKHVLFKAYEQGNGDPAFDLIGGKNINSDGYMVLDSTKDYVDVSATINIPKDYKSGKIGLKFALGAFLKSFPEEVGLNGYMHIRDFKITANKQFTVNFVSQNKTVATKYVNEGEKVDTFAAKRKGYTLAGYTSNGASYNFDSLVPSDLTLVAQWKKTVAPAKVKIASVKSTSAKKAVVSLKKAKNAKGYAVQYSTKSNFKGAKQVTSKKTKITLKKLKSGTVVYVRAKAYVTDSADNKVFGKKWSAKKLVVVK